MFIKKSHRPGFKGQNVVAGRIDGMLSPAQIQRQIEKIPGVKFETIDGEWVVTGLAKLTAADIPADVQPLIRNYLFRNRYFTLKD
jgi:hypothetical protein